MHALNFDQLNIQFGHLGSQDGIFLSLYKYKEILYFKTDKRLRNLRKFVAHHALMLRAR